jgi:23S rRNA (uridine2552-2'-O)-methyltransferase
MEIDDKDKLLAPGMTVLDLGSAPGSWSQVVVEKVGKTGAVFAIDILEMEPLHQVNFMRGDFTEQATLDLFRQQLGDKKVDLVISDMAPNISGVPSVDQARSMHLAELALECAGEVLKPQGTFLVKVFQGEGFDQFVQQLRPEFKNVLIRKPKASRDRSNEVYLLGKGFQARKK